jgi:hypothetical protein
MAHRKQFARKNANLAKDPKGMYKGKNCKCKRPKVEANEAKGSNFKLCFHT